MTQTAESDQPNLEIVPGPSADELAQIFELAPELSEAPVDLEEIEPVGSGENVDLGGISEVVPHSENDETLVKGTAENEESASSENTNVKIVEPVLAREKRPERVRNRPGHLKDFV